MLHEQERQRRVMLTERLERLQRVGYADRPAVVIRWIIEDWQRELRELEAEDRQ